MIKKERPRGGHPDDVRAALFALLKDAWGVDAQPIDKASFPTFGFVLDGVSYLVTISGQFEVLYASPAIVEKTRKILESGGGPLPENPVA